MRIILAAAVFVSMTLPVAAKTKIHAPDAAPPATYEAVKQAAEICSAKGAFGRSFARSGRIDTTATDDWAPFSKLSLASSEIRAEASFHGTGETREEDIAQADDFARALEKAITAKHLFAHNKKHGDGMEFRSSEDGSGLSLLLSQSEDHVIASCVENGH